MTLRPHAPSLAVTEDSSVDAQRKLSDHFLAKWGVYHARECTPPALTTKEVAMTDKKELSREGLFREVIALRAYELYLQRGGENGNEIEDWLTAEKEVTVGPVSMPKMKSAQAGRTN